MYCFNGCNGCKGIFYIIKKEVDVYLKKYFFFFFGKENYILCDCFD